MLKFDYFGCEVLGVAIKHLDPKMFSRSDPNLQLNVREGGNVPMDNMTFLGMVGMTNMPSEEAYVELSKFQDMKVKFIMHTDKHPYVASQLAE